MADASGRRQPITGRKQIWLTAMTVYPPALDCRRWLMAGPCSSRRSQDWRTCCPLWVIGACILLYNLVFFLIARRTRASGGSPRAYRWLAYAQMILDWLRLHCWSVYRRIVSR